MVVFYNLHGDNKFYVLKDVVLDENFIYPEDYRNLWMVPGTFDQDD